MNRVLGSHNEILDEEKMKSIVVDAVLVHIVIHCVVCCVQEHSKGRK